MGKISKLSRLLIVLCPRRASFRHAEAMNMYANLNVIKDARSIVTNADGRADVAEIVDLATFLTKGLIL